LVHPRENLKAVLRTVDRALPWSLLYRGDRVECPCCGGRFRSFRRHPGRPGALCPRCHSLERHRLLWLWLRERGEIFTERLDLLHFAPEIAFEPVLAAQSNLHYVPADLHPTTERQIRVDIMGLPFEDASFDVVLCNHVLGEVPDDRRAIAELHRVLRPGGRLITTNVINESLAETRPRPRRAARPGEGQLTGGNIRLYGRDFPERLAAPGFDVEVVRYLDAIPEEQRERYGLREVGGAGTGNDVYVARKAARDEASGGAYGGAHVRTSGAGLEQPR